MQHSITGANGVRLNVIDEGQPDGPPMLFIHGWSQSHLCWTKQLNSPLRERFRLVAFDLRGHGDSDKPLDGYMESAVWADDVHAVIASLALSKPLLVGWSYAGLVMNDYVRQHGQDSIAGLCYVGAASDLGIETSYDFLGASWNGLLPTREASVAGTVFSDNDEEIASAMRRFLRGCFSQPLPADEEMMMLGFNLECPSRVRAALLSRILRNDDVLARLSVPVLVSHGAADEVVRIATGKHIASKVKQAQLSTYEDAAHALFWEQPDRFNRELAEFASALSARAEATLTR